MLDALGNRMSQRIARLHRSPINKFRVRSRKALLSSLRGYGLWRAGGGGVGLDDLDLADEARNLAR
jgi:hypothetical protein